MLSTSNTLGTSASNSNLPSGKSMQTLIYQKSCTNIDIAKDLGECLYYIACALLLILLATPLIVDNVTIVNKLLIGRD